MKNKKWVRAMALGAALCMALSGCGKNSGNAGTTDKDGNWSPGKKITMLVPMAPGGGSDMSGRAIASGLEKVTGSTISVENKAGGGGAVGYGAFLTEEGNPAYLIASETALVNLALTEDVPFSWRSFTPIMKVGQDPSMVITSADSKYSTCVDFIEDAKKREDLRVGVSGGVTGNDAIQFGLIEQDQGVKFNRVPYESGGEVTTALLGHHIDAGLANPSEVAGQLEAGKLKALCVLSKERLDYPEVSDIETSVEQGINVTFAQYRGIFAPGGISDEAKEYWINASKEYVETDEYKNYMKTNYMQIDPLFGDDFAKYLEGYEKELATGLEQVDK
ncbi:tripartite tricarboxylate transporter substrate binding protein [Actinobaculum suis]|uniref:tripartite tricarboxylate transporter substrate binding protein n=1 Tax=Actinobaculum suis TaxID=1657 RepID=UPI000808685B|nr:tripartite tricarboxylate transporter substrate-binding protein [Actinobaculum suis]OCA93582.1 twin-arginine translocation pathway signal protein [Actinobaculum suis]OCA93700.1 twin-arginine translocation pathway signal protein [Actinobaculum suis]